jgi:hypothetical protein
LHNCKRQAWMDHAGLIKCNPVVKEGVKTCQKLWPFSSDWNLGLPACLKICTEAKQYYMHNAGKRYTTPCVTCMVNWYSAWTASQKITVQSYCIQRSPCERNIYLCH